MTDAEVVPVLLLLSALSPGPVGVCRGLHGRVVDVADALLLLLVVEMAMAMATTMAVGVLEVLLVVVLRLLMMMIMVMMMMIIIMIIGRALYASERLHKARGQPARVAHARCNACRPHQRLRSSSLEPLRLGY